MRRTVNMIFFIGFCVVVSAQQKPHYTQYILNQYILNPAISGIENYVDVKLSHRHQWVGIQDAPVTTYFTIQGPLGKKDYRTTATSYSVPGQNPRGKSYWESYNAAEPHHGIGLQVIDDKTGPLSNLSVQATYAYHIGLSPKTSIAAGFGAGFNRIGLDASKLSFAVSVDPAVYNSGFINKMTPELSTGIYLYSSDFFVGVSAQQVVPQKIEFADNIVRKTDGRTVPHLFATAGYRFLVGEDFNLIPSVMVKWVSPAPQQYEGNLKLQYRDLAWIGASYRHKDGFAGMLGLNVSNIFNVGYAYDYTTSGLNNYSKGTHELMIGFLLGNRYGETCPKNVW
ncbi:MAG: type IX secretion system membrane protein PorP/SprF [Terrimonas sp.]|nr:type IX secretion system membrane protein PorP/SprF [Terrimonas sp.]